MLSKYIFIWTLVMLLPLPILAQEQAMNFEEILMELIGEEATEDLDLSEILEKLYYYQRHPIPLNVADEQLLGELQFLNAQQISNILAHRAVTGGFISLLELQGIHGLDLQTAIFLQQFVTLGESSIDKIDWTNLLSASEQHVMLRYGRVVEKQRGYGITDETKSRYIGDPNRYAIRYRLNHENQFKISLNAEKDAGEPFFKNEQRFGFDFYSGSLEWNRTGKVLNKVIVGDYALQFGQGLIAWNGLSFGKGAYLQSIARQGQGIRAYSSMNEVNFLRGTAINLQWHHISIKPFLAYNRLSGKVEENEDGNTFISTMSVSGLHRTPTELGYRHQIGQWVWGAHMTYQLGRLRVGTTYKGTKFSGEVQRGDELREQYDFQGNQLHQLGINYQFNYRNYLFFGETASNIGGSWATSNGVMASLDPKLSLFAHYRNYQRDYHHFHARALGETSAVSNESGILGGLQYTLLRKLEWSNYIDLFKFPWLRYRVDAPSTGVDLLSQLTYSWYKRGKMILRYRYRLKEENVSIANRAENYIAQVFRNQLRGEFQYKWSEQWNTRSRMEWNRYDKEYSHISKGYMVYQDVFWKPRKSSIQTNARLAYFQTDDYDARIYAYESDVLYGGSFPMYYDKGWRYYANIRYRLNKSMDIWARFAQTYYTDREQVGSGLDLIDGNKKSDVKIQVRWQW